MRTFTIPVKMLESAIEKMDLSDDKINEINRLQSAISGESNKKSDRFKQNNQRMGQIYCAIKMRVLAVCLIRVTKALHKLLSTMPTHEKTYNQIIKIVEELLASSVAARNARPVIEPVFKMDW